MASRNKKIVKLQGGLGNQMFQYAFARGLTAKTGDDVLFDFSGLNPLPGVTKRFFALDAWNTNTPAASDTDIQKFTSEKRLPRLSAMKRTLGFKVPRYVHEKEHGFNPDIFNIEGPAYFDGYWQSEKYFSHVEDEIRSAFTLKTPLSSAGREFESQINNESISLHIRRGDYVTIKKVSNVLGALDLDYYEKALSEALKGLTEPRIFVFSDDIPWARQNIRAEGELIFASEHTSLEDWEEIILMSKCRKHIIANSSFSWWGAWLDPRPDKIVIAPRAWFKLEKLNSPDRIPKSWIRK